MQALPPGRADLLLAGAFFLETQLELSFLDALEAAQSPHAACLAMALGVAARRRAPLADAALVFAALLVAGQLSERKMSRRSWRTFASAFIVSYSIGAPTSRAAAWRWASRGWRRPGQRR